MAAVVALLFIAVVISRFEGGGDVTSLYRSEEKAPAAPADSGLGGTVRRLPVAGRLESRAGHVVASGRVLRGDGSPAAGVFVALAKPSTGIFGALGGALGAGLGVGCVPDAISCGAGRSVGKTAADGSYALRLDAVADAYVIQARTAHSDDNGAFLEVRLPEPRPDVAGGTVPIPVLRFWEPESARSLRA